MQQQWGTLFGKMVEKPAASAAAAEYSSRAKRVALASSTEAKSEVALKLGVISAQRTRLLEAAVTYQFSLNVEDAVYVSMKSAHDQ
eukprot:7555233-Pyramimonas_sp.AAC.1